MTPRPPFVFDFLEPRDVPALAAEQISGGLAQLVGVAHATVANGGVVFASSGSLDPFTTSGSELHVTDGTASGTRLLVDVKPGYQGGVGGPFVPLNGLVFFPADDGSNGRELWRTDGTASGTFLVKDLNPGAYPNSSLPSDFGVGGLKPAVAGGFLYFSASDGEQNELWKTDGSTAGTTRAVDLNGASSSLPRDMTEVGGRVYFTALTPLLPPGDRALHAYDPIADTTTVLTFTSDMNPPVPIGGTNLANSGGTLYFSARPTNDTAGTELYKAVADGTVTRVGDIAVPMPGRNDRSSFPQGLFDFNGVLLFTASAGDDNSRELYRVNPTTGLPELLLDASPAGVGDSLAGVFNGFVAFNGAVYFDANDPVTGVELWRTDGTPAGTRLVKDVKPGAGSGLTVDDTFPNTFTATAVDGFLYFPANDGSAGFELWKTDGSEAGTTLVDDVKAGPQSSDPYGFVN
ncbi:MAG: ELWxxDGT repeat protein, partial [Planctomycetia bacterium]